MMKTSAPVLGAIASESFRMGTVAPSGCATRTTPQSSDSSVFTVATSQGTAVEARPPPMPSSSYPNSATTLVG